jgi:hypothetical protein
VEKALEPRRWNKMDSSNYEFYSKAGLSRQTTETGKKLKKKEKKERKEGRHGSSQLQPQLLRRRFTGTCLE